MAASLNQQFLKHSDLDMAHILTERRILANTVLFDQVMSPRIDKPYHHISPSHRITTQVFL